MLGIAISLVSKILKISDSINKIVSPTGCELDLEGAIIFRQFVAYLGNFSKLNLGEREGGREGGRRGIKRETERERERER